MAPKVTVKELRAEARRRLLHCGNGKTISRMNKSELLSFMSCIDHPDNDRYQSAAATQRQPSLARMFAEPRAPKAKKRRGRPMPSDYSPVSEEPDDLSDISLQSGRGLPNTYRAFVKAMLPRAQREHDGPNAMRAVAKMWQQHKQQRWAGLHSARGAQNTVSPQSGPASGIDRSVDGRGPGACGPSSSMLSTLTTVWVRSMLLGDTTLNPRVWPGRTVISPILNDAALSDTNGHTSRST